MTTPTWRAGLIALSIATLGGLTMPPASGSGPSGETEGVEGFHGQHVRWSPCEFDTDVECATIEVPMDYDEPEGRRIEVAISRQAATDAGARRGVLLVNPGGPGGSGLATVGADGEEVSWPKDRFGDMPLNERYDLIGFDPRGVGRSTPLSCEQAEAAAPLVSRPGPADIAAQVTWAQQTEAGCEKVSGDLRPHINTRDTARDMDIIRAVLGEETISYVGYSYGTYLGAVYGSMFPSRVDRSVLDSSVSGDMDWRATDMASAIAATRNVELWAQWAAERHGRYQLGTSPAEVLATVERTSAQLPTDEETFGSQQTQFDRAMGFHSDLRESWPGLAELVRETRDSGEFTPPGPPAAPEDEDEDEDEDEHEHEHEDQHPTAASVVTGYIPVNQTVHCETEWPTAIAPYAMDVERFTQSHPYGVGAASAMPHPCTFRESAPKEEATVLQRDGYPTGLIVQAEGDIQTPYEGGVEMAERLDHRLITVVDDGHHGQYARRDNTCVDAAVNRYLLYGEVPEADLTCAGAPRPDVPADGSADAR